MKRQNKQMRIVYGFIILVIIILGIWFFFFHDTEGKGSITFVEETAVIEYGEAYDAKQFIKSVDGEISEYPSIDIKRIGEQELAFIVSKDGKEKRITYTIEVKDTKPPVIQLTVENISLYVNDSFSPETYILSISDPIDGALTKSDDGDALGAYWVENPVDTSQTGNYEVMIYAKDASGNMAQKTLYVEVSEKETNVSVENPNEGNSYPSTNGYDNEIDPANCKPFYVNGILLVNKRHPLPPSFGSLDPEAAAALEQLQAAAGNAGYSIPTVSGFRDYQYQVGLYNYYVERDGQDAADTYSARPGFSEHQTGLVFDVGSIDNDYGTTPEGIWLREHCHEFGFIIRYPQGKENITGYMYEPWHIRYVGIEAATQIYERDITLEEYLGVY